MISELPTAPSESGDERLLDKYDDSTMDLVQEGAHAMHAVERNSDDVSSIELVSTKKHLDSL
eukprot:SAG11_NODE_28360_length_322_cov_1.286996_1_plen_61_part_10